MPILFTTAMPKLQALESLVPECLVPESAGPRVPGPRVPGPRVHGTRVSWYQSQLVPGSLVPESAGPRIPGPRVSWHQSPWSKGQLVPESLVPESLVSEKIINHSNLIYSGRGKRQDASVSRLVFVLVCLKRRIKPKTIIKKLHNDLKRQRLAIDLYNEG